MKSMTVDWSQVKVFVDQRKLSVQYVELSDSYMIAAFDGPFCLDSLIAKSTPRNSAQIDFEDNYKTNGNQKLDSWLEKPTFSIATFGQTLGTNKSMIHLFNPAGSGVKLKIREIKIINSQTTAITFPNVADFRLRRNTGSTNGTSLTIEKHDSLDAPASGIVATTGSTIQGASASHLRRWIWSGDEWSSGTLDVEAQEHAAQTVANLIEIPRYAKPIIINPGEGIDIVQLVTTTTGMFDFMIVFTQELT